MSILHLSKRCLAAAGLALALLPSLARADGELIDYRMNEQVLRVPLAADSDITLETTLFRPDGPGPFPVLVINHGKEAGAARKHQRERFYHMARRFVELGYAVAVPMRQGFAGSGGNYVQYGCDMAANGQGQARDIAAVLAHVRTQPWADGDHIVVAGQSYGGLATLALGTRELPGVRGLINVAGGLRDSACDWRTSLIAAFGQYGARATLPSLWLYGANDMLFDLALARQLHAAYTAAGGQAELVELPPFKRDAHGMLASRDGSQVWLPHAQQFLARIGMPATPRYTVAPLPLPLPTGYAKVDDVAAVPYLSDSGRDAYRAYLGKHTPRAFAVSPSGAWTWAEEGEDPVGRALATCSAASKAPCALYSIDEDVVWQDSPVRSVAAHGAGAAESATGASQAP